MGRTREEDLFLQVLHDGVVALGHDLVLDVHQRLLDLRVGLGQRGVVRMPADTAEAAATNAASAGCQSQQQQAGRAIPMAGGFTHSLGVLVTSTLTMSR
jgi:hypothetical protein